MKRSLAWSLRVGICLLALVMAPEYKDADVGLYWICATWWIFAANWAIELLQRDREEPKP